MTTNSNLPAQTETAPVTAIGLGDSKSFDLIQRVAKCMAMSTLVPKAFQNNLPNCIIALNMAGRMNADPLMVCQNLYVVHGTPAWSAQFLIATFNKSGKFSSIRYDFFGTEGQDDWGCRAKATELSTGELLTGPLVTIALAKKEGWHQKGGSKWQTMPEQMLRYRAAAWFVRTIAPEIAMGLQTAEEMRDTYELENDGNAFSLPPKGQASTDLNAMLHHVEEEPVIEAQATPVAEPEPASTANKRHSVEELDAMRDDLVDEIADREIALAEIEKIVGAYANKWTPKQIAEIRAKHLPNILAELAGA